MRHLQVSLPASMNRSLLLLFILGLGHCIYAASVFQFPDLTRRLPERTTSPGCAYKGDRYDHGDRVPTAEPCLNCTCIRAVLVCYLRVCPTSSAPPPGCFAAREVGECCPTLVCGGVDLSRPSNKSDSNLDLRPTFQPEPQETATDAPSTTEDYPSDISASVSESESDTSLSADVSEVGTSTTDNNVYYTTQTAGSSPTDIPSTVSDSIFHTTLNEDDSLVYISSTQEPTQDYDINFFNDIPGGCMVNGTLYGDGSAMLSSTFCEYCFCIRGKSTCLKPKCHLTIDGCIPHYDNNYSCCPSRYDCSQKVSSTAIISSTESPTMIPSTAFETTAYLGDSSDCIVDGKIYHQGEVVPDRQACHNCYCSDSSVVCEKIKCSPPLEGCQPIIPAGHCCPISYRCDYQGGHSESNSIKGANVNDSRESGDNKGTDIKSIKNYDGRVKSPNDRESVAVLHNLIPIHRRLDENVVHERNSTVKNIETSPVYIGSDASTKAYTDLENADHTRENDKTLNLEPNDTTFEVSYPAENRAFEDIEITDSPRYESSSMGTVSVGSPEVHTLSIQALFNKFFLKHLNSSKFQFESSESKRNNSKQPSSIVEIYDSETDIPDSTTTTSIINTKITTIPEITKEGTETVNLQTDLTTSSQDSPRNNTNHNTNLGLEYTPTEPIIDTTHVANLNQESSFFNQPKIENEVTFSIFPNTETHKSDEFASRSDTESTYPVFISTTKKGNEDFPTHSTLPEFTTSFETNPSELLTTISDLFNIKFSTQPETHATFPFVNTHSERARPTQFPTPVYTTTKSALIEGLQRQTDSRPVVLIYDTTKKIFTETPKVHSQAQTTTLLYDLAKHSFEDEPKHTETSPPSLWYETTKELFGEDVAKQTDTDTAPPIYITTKNVYSEPHSTSPEYTSTIKLMKNEEKTETPLFTSHSSTTTRNINTEYQTETQPSLAPFSTTKYLNNEGQTTTQYSSVHTTKMNDPITELQKETETPSVIPTHLIQQHVDNADFRTQTDPQSGFFTTNIFTKSEGISKEAEIQKTSPAFVSTGYQNTKETTHTIPTTQTVSTTKIPGNTFKPNGIDTTTFFTTNIVKDPSTNPSLPSLEVAEHKDTVTTESTKIPPRINSKLPSFNYIENANERNTSTHPRFPVVSDSVVNVYLPTEKQTNITVDAGDFMNIGSVYLGAPLSVGGTDSRKDIDKQKTKITQSGGVIFMDPKYTDIDTKLNFENQEEKSPKGTVSTDNRNQTTEEKTDKDSSNERKKGPRIQDGTGQGYKIIPFVAEDAIRGQFSKLNNTLVVQPGGPTEGIPDMVSDFCFIKGRIYLNGEMIGKPDPCELCRCFYGRELCQIQRCPTPPDCIAEKVPGFCCPRFTCGNNSTSGEQISKEIKPVSHAHIPEVVTSTTRRPDVTERNPSTNNRQEIKYGIRVRTRTTTSTPVRSTERHFFSVEHTTERKILPERITTAKPEIQTPTSKAPTITTTTSKKPQVVRTTTTTTTTTSKKPETRKTTTSTTTTTTPSPIFPDPWGLLKVSGCNIYGKFFNINDQVEILSGPCSHCICTTNGVECNDIC